MQTTWRSVILAVAVSLVLAAVALFVIFRFFLPQADTPETTPQPQFVIGDWEGQVAVFEGQKTYPMQVFDVYVSTLPAEERSKVQAGIPVEDETQLSLLLEDYTG